MAVFRAFYRIFRRTLFVSVLCFAFGFVSARAEEYTIAYLNQYGDEISDLTPDRYKEEELPLARENLPNSEAVSIATGCELVDELWYWDDEMSEPVESIEPEPFEDKVLYGKLSCDENRIVTLNPEGKEGIGSEGTRTLYYYHNLGDYGEFFYNEYNGSKSASGVASSIVLPTYDDKSYTFLGYYSDPGDMKTQCVDERGYITEYGFQQMAEGGEGETSWDAVYEERSVADVHTVNYNCGNHGSGSPVSQSANAYDYVNLHLANVCAPDSGYEFFGWSCYTSDTNASPNTIIKAAGESLFMSVDWTCTALWVDVCPNSGVRMSILDDYSGTQADLVNNSFSSYATVSASGMCSSTPGTYQYQSMVQEPSPGTGYCWCHIMAFNGVSVSDYSPWVYISGNGGLACNNDDCLAACNRYTDNNAMGRISLTDACAYNLSYTCGVISGSVYPQSDTVFFNETVNLPQYANGCTYVSGANFLGWDCHVSGNPNTINNGYSLTMPDNNVVCDALWDVPQYTLTYDCGDGTGSPWTQATYDYTGNTQNIATLTGAQASSHCTAPTGYQANVTSWNCGGNNTNVTPGNSISINNTTTCTAQWTPNANPIIYKCGILNNDATAHDPTYVATGATQDLTNIEPVYCTDASTLGYTFSHWKCCYTNANTLQGNVDTTQNCPANTGSSLWSILPGGWIGTVCEAQWTQVPTTYTVTYHGGSCNASASTFNETVDAGASYTVQNPHCSGSNNIVQSYLPTDGCSEFVGWSNSVSSNNVVYGSCVGGGNCSNPTTGNCGTISNVSNNVDLYAVCQSQLHNVIYHSGNCDSNDYSYTHNSVLNLGSTYTVLSPFVAPLLSQNPASLNIPQSSFQGWASSLVPAGEASWCVLDSNKLYSKLVGGKTNNTSFVYQKDGKTCPDIELYAVCCPLNLNWDVNGGSWPLDANNNELTNQSTCIYGSSAGTAGAIGYGQTPLRVPVRTGYTFNGWKVTNYGTP